MSAAAEVRRLRADELKLAQSLLAPQGWSLEAAELERVWRLGGAVGAFGREGLVGFLHFLDAPPHRWIGNVVVAPAARGAGVGARMVAEATRDAPRCALYSVEKAVPLYLRLGFAPQGEVLAMRAERAPAARAEDAQPASPEDVPAMAALDRRMTGMDRRGLLDALVAAYPARLVRRGGEAVAYGVAKTYGDVTEVGPVVAREPADAARVLDSLLAASPGPYEMAVHGANARALALARERGFAPTFRAIPMFTGEPPAWRLDAYHAAAGLEKG